LTNNSRDKRIMGWGEYTRKYVNKYKNNSRSFISPIQGISAISER